MGEELLQRHAPDAGTADVEVSQRAPADGPLRREVLGGAAVRVADVAFKVMCRAGCQAHAGHCTGH